MRRLSQEPTVRVMRMRSSHSVQKVACGVPENFSTHNYSNYPLTILSRAGNTATIMALIIISGLPCSGRSTRATELVKDFERRIASSSTSPALASISRIEIVSDATVHNAKGCYSTQRLEKPARASYLSAVTRSIGKDCITVADGGAGLNIKGFRYQLWCAAREEGVRCVSVQVHAPPEICKQWNQSRRAREEESYDDDT